MELIYAAIDDLNAQSVKGVVVEKKPDSVLLGEKGIDSLAFINLIVAIEDQIQRQTGKAVVLVDEEYMAAEEHPFRTVRSLTNYVERILDGMAS